MALLLFHNLAACYHVELLFVVVRLLVVGSLRNPSVISLSLTRSLRMYLVVALMASAPLEVTVMVLAAASTAEGRVTVSCSGVF